MAKYKLVVDFGDPYEKNINSDSELKRELLKLKRQARKHEDDYGYFDVHVYDEKDNDITDKVFKKFKIMN